jgi:heat shock protein HtpX
MSIWKLRLSIAATLAVIIGLSTLAFTAILLFTGYFDFITLGILVAAFNIIQWLISPYIIGALYRTRELAQNENPQLHQTIQNLSQKTGIKTPKLMLAQIPIPNAFAYGSPLTGNRIAVTKGLTDTLTPDEVEAVIGHELGHLKHKDVQTLMFVSILPAIFYFLGYTLMLQSWYGGRQRQEGSSALIGMAFMAFSWILNLFILNLSRTREYYADRHSATIIPDGAQKLSTGLARIVNATKNLKRNKQQAQNLNAFKALFITDPDHAQIDSAQITHMTQAEGSKLVQEHLAKKITTADKIIEILSTHPNIVKRLRALQELT